MSEKICRRKLMSDRVGGRQEMRWKMTIRRQRRKEIYMLKDHVYRLNLNLDL